MRYFIATLLALAVFVGLPGCRGKGDLAELAARAEKWERAVSLYREYLNEHPNDIIALRTISSILAYELGEYEEAAMYADTLVAHRAIDTLGVSVSTYAHTMLAQAAAQRGDTAEVVRHLDQIAETYFIAGYWHYRNNNYELADWLLRQVVRLQPKRVEPYLRLGQNFHHWEKPDSAVVWFRRAAKVDRGNLDAYTNIVATYYLNGQREKAREALEELEAVRSRFYPDSTFAADTVGRNLPPLTLDYRWARHDY